MYITARPDMQQKKVVAWLAQHNFPHGMVSFMDGMSVDPLRQKANYLKGLTRDVSIDGRVEGDTRDVSIGGGTGYGTTMTEGILPEGTY